MNIIIYFNFQVNIHEKIKETVSRNINNLNKSKNTDKQQVSFLFLFYIYYKHKGGCQKRVSLDKTYSHK